MLRDLVWYENDNEAVSFSSFLYMCFGTVYNLSLLWSSLSVRSGIMALGYLRTQVWHTQAITIVPSL